MISTAGTEKITKHNVNHERKPRSPMLLCRGKSYRCGSPEKSKAFDHGAHSKKDTEHQLRASQKLPHFPPTFISKPQKKKEKENRNLLLRSTETETGSRWVPQSDRDDALTGSPPPTPIPPAPLLSSPRQIFLPTIKAQDSAGAGLETIHVPTISTIRFLTDNSDPPFLDRVVSHASVVPARHTPGLLGFCRPAPGPL
jgi:hypothetical protein